MRSAQLSSAQLTHSSAQLSSAHTLIRSAQLSSAHALIKLSSAQLTRSSAYSVRFPINDGEPRHFREEIADAFKNDPEHQHVHEEKGQEQLGYDL